MKSSPRVVWPLVMGNKCDLISETFKLSIYSLWKFNQFKYISNASPYDNRWSKTMLGYGPESSHFHVELIYNYGVTSYDLGNFSPFSSQNKCRMPN